MLFGILLTLNIIVCLALVAVVLLQRSEGGALGMGGGPTGFMSARGAGDLLTRTTWILFGAFLVLSLALTLLSGRQSSSASITDKLKIDGLDPDALKVPAPAAPATPASPDLSQPAPIQAPVPSLNPLLPAAPAAQAPQAKPAAAPATPAAQQKKPAAAASRPAPAPAEQSQPAPAPPPAPAEQPAQQQ